MQGVEIYGTAAVSSMAIFYALEERDRVFVLLFAVSCLASSTYALLIASWPFAVIEALWAVIAFRRWIASEKKSESA